MGIDTTLLLTAGSFLASMVLNKAVDVVLDEALQRFLTTIRSIIAHDKSVQGGVSIPANLQLDPTVLQEVQGLYDDYPVMRRVQLVADLLPGARLLWVDDWPENNLYERATFISLGIEITLATGTEEALAMLRTQPFDLLISDMERYGNSTAGLALLDEIRSSPASPATIFYVGSLDRERGVPPGAFGITNRPDELIHLVLDVLERTRV